MSAIADRGSKRERIIAAAVKVFSQKGYHSARMEEIAIAAGIGKGTVYEYFDSKLQLLQAVMEKTFRRYDSILAGNISESLDFKTRIKLLLESHFRFCQDNKDLTRFLFWDNEVIDEELRAWVLEKGKQKEARLQETVRTAIAEGEIRSVDPYLVTIIVSGIFSAIWMPVVMGGWEADPSVTAEAVADILMRGLQKQL